MKQIKTTGGDLLPMNETETEVFHFGTWKEIQTDQDGEPYIIGGLGAVYLVPVMEVVQHDSRKQYFTLEDMYMLAAKVVDDIAANRMNGEWNLKTTPKMIADDFIENGFKGYNIPVTQPGERKQTAGEPCPTCGTLCQITWAGLELVENTGDETLATKCYNPLPSFEEIEGLQEENRELKKGRIMLLLNEGTEDEATTFLDNYVNSLDEDDFDTDFLNVINLRIGHSCQYGADEVKRIS